MKLILFITLFASANAAVTQVAGTCAANCDSCSYTPTSGTAQTKRAIDGTLSATNNTCKLADSASCHADSTKFFCPADNSCDATNCNSCTGYTLEPGATGATGGARSASNNTCQRENAASCHADSTKFYCDVTHTCIASNCTTCTLTASGTTTHKKLNPDGSQSATNNTCRAATGAICHADSTKYFCEALGVCQATNCNSCTGYVLEPGGTNAVQGTRSSSANTCEREFNAKVCHADSTKWYCSVGNSGAGTCIATNCASCANGTTYHKLVASGSQSNTNNTCRAATSEICHGDSSKFFCPATGTCVATNCNSCTGYLLEPGDTNATGGARSAANNTCQKDNSASCHADSSKFFCPHDDSCDATNCNSCTGYTLEPGDTNATGGSRSATNNTCQKENAASCHADSTKFFCPADDSCDATDCNSCTGYTLEAGDTNATGGTRSATNNTCQMESATSCGAGTAAWYCGFTTGTAAGGATGSPAGVAAPGILATLLAAVAVALRM